MIRLHSIPTVVAVYREWGAEIASGASLLSHTVLGITASAVETGEWDAEQYSRFVKVDSILAADVVSEGINLFAATVTTTVMSGSGNLEHFSVAGVALNNAPIQENYVTWGFENSTQDISNYSTEYDGTNYFGDTRRIALRNEGLIWLRFSGSSAAVVGHYVSPSSGSDGYAELAVSGTAAVNMTYGKVYGYASGSNIGGFSSGGAVQAAQFVLVHFDRGNW